MDNNLKKYVVDYEVALAKKSKWISHWEECLKYSVPEKEGMFNGFANSGGKKNTHLFDSTAQNGVENLASSLVSNITPSWRKWFSLQFNDVAGDDESLLNDATSILKGLESRLEYNFNQSNFSLEIHQCFLDLVSVGTACILFEENQVGESSVFKFKSVPISEIVIEEGAGGTIDKVFRASNVSLENLQERFVSSYEKIVLKGRFSGKIKLIEAVIPRFKSTGKQGYNYVAFVENPNFKDGKKGQDKYIILHESVLQNNPFIVFRWLKNTSEIYGRSPVMKVLPDIKTVNKVVELVLKNATLAISGVWQADDDGVINLENIDLSPGTIIPKAVGSSGLTALQTTANFDVSQLVLSDLRGNINRAFFADEIGFIGQNSGMSATEVLQRTQNMARALSSVYGRLQTELLNPIVGRAVDILRKRGDVDFDVFDRNCLNIKFKSSIANVQMRQDAENLITWVKSVSALGADVKEKINMDLVAKHLSEALGLSGDFLNKDIE